MKLVDLLASEFGVDLNRLMLLRHSTGSVEDLRKSGSTILEYTAIQPIDTTYDYYCAGRPPVEIVAVISEDRVTAVFRILGVRSVGTNYSLGSDAYRHFDTSRGKPEIAAKAFDLEPLESITIGLPITGWERRQRTTVQRADGTFFHEIAVRPARPRQALAAVTEAFETDVSRSIRGDEQSRRERLYRALPTPTKVEVLTTVFVRNPDVVAEVLLRANGRCQSCGLPAPFVRRSDGSPYLEVHHTQPLALGGDDTVENAVALCPNCHRRKHHG